VPSPRGEPPLHYGRRAIHGLGGLAEPPLGGRPSRLPFSLGRVLVMLHMRTEPILFGTQLVLLP
jgi:hypothetical protein